MTLESLIPPGMSLEDLLVVMSSLSVLVSILAVWFTLLHRDVAAKRAQMIAGRRLSMRATVMVVLSR